MALLKAGADLNLPDIYGQTPVFAAAAKGQGELVTILRKAGANIKKAKNDGTTPMMVAKDYQTFVALTGPIDTRHTGNEF